ncbi:hypothetical protein COCNU_01G001890 [Cocos nucifera]|uniref:type I protein arginine methyltransferase n=1 Tax=Cocos nucifera TaxID=13894 RepID=A0A8K0HU78_COCNU|nr:hypothetical protein COCNU_01G001890 [Cocos nucifera]
MAAVKDEGIYRKRLGDLEDKQGLAPISKFDDKIEAASSNMYFHYDGQLRHQQTILEDHVMTGDLEDKQGLAPISKFDDKIEAASSNMYFHYDGQLRHQQTILEDHVMTGTYYTAIIKNHVDFQGRVVVEVGAGTGILSLFAAQAGAKHVYAIEASEMAEHACMLIAGNPALGQRITVIKGKVEEVELPEKVDILISEPMGTLLVNGRMLESYVIARDRFLVYNGKMFPSAGRIYMAPFSDEHLFVEIANKALFWQQQNYYGVDLTPLYGSFFKGYFSQPVLDAFDQSILISPAIFYTLDFTSIKAEELYEINIPLNFVASDTSINVFFHMFVFFLQHAFKEASLKSMNEFDSSNGMNEFDPSITMRSPDSIWDMLDSFKALDSPETLLEDL